MVASLEPRPGDLACNPGMCPDWESNLWPFGLQPTLNPLSYTSQGLFLFLKIVVQVQSSPFSHHHFPLAPPTLTSYPQSYPTLAFSMCPLYMFLDDPSQFSPIMAFHLPSGYCQFVFYFNVSGYILLACLFC